MTYEAIERLGVLAAVLMLLVLAALITVHQLRTPRARTAIHVTPGEVRGRHRAPP